METVLQSSVSNSPLQKTLTLMERFKQQGDTTRVEKVEKLLKKIHQNEFIVAFTGHFSAGKSTMINALIGEQVLPSSPIPTSANIVKIFQSDSEYAKVYYQQELPVLFQAPYSFETVKEYCKNEEVLEIEIGRKESLLPEGVSIMDTPGVDSTDDAHRISTESSLHLADIVFYVMDYNHVQSELNFIYTKKLLEYGTNLYLIINQIDKHNESELTFKQFKQSVIKSFDDWDVQPTGIFFTSLKQSSHVENEFNAVKLILNDAMVHRDEWMDKTITIAMNRLVDEHNQWLKEQVQHQIEPYEKIILNYDELDFANILEKEQELIQTKHKLEAQVEHWRKEAITEQHNLLKNAYLMPFETRELAEQFLEANQPNFKVGLLFSKKKTDIERENRLETFALNVKKQVESQIDWHLRQWAATALKDLEIFDEKLQFSANKLEVVFDNTLFIKAINKGAGVTGEYILHYCEEVGNRLKKIAKKVMDNFIDQITDALQIKVQHQTADLETELQPITRCADAYRKIAEIEKEYEKSVELLTISTGEEEKVFRDLLDKWDNEQDDVRVYEETDVKLETKEYSEVQERVNTPPPMKVTEVEDVLSTIEQAIPILRNTKGLQKSSEQLESKIARLKDRSFTIALFGAFSAGKSSFANALMGDGVLPVSPNPTTAAINRICPVTEENPHATAKIYFKSKQQMLDDIVHSLSMFEITCNSLEQAYELIPQVISKADADGKEKIHLSFLQAFYNGYETFEQYLGNTLTTSLDEFKQYVGNEVQACFVEAIDLFFDCEITQQGITLVDTPGADSINARHTGVAFEYIKNADAILFVTYYNHAFSKADREFIIQLGRVKDAFELDKMFFIVNAIDLAKDEEEVQEVLDYVQSELGKNGVRNPKIFGISSKLALDEQTKLESNVDIFKEKFHHFLKADLTQIAVQSAVTEYNRVITILDQLISSASMNEEEKQKRVTSLKETQKTIQKWLKNQEISVMSERLAQEMKELLFYVKQRVFYRFSDFFKEAFNPAVLQSPNKEQLKKCLDELLGSTSYDLLQELRATSLRAERFYNKMLEERLKSMEKELQQINRDLSIPVFEVSDAAIPEFMQAFKDIERKQLENHLKYFKNARSFFEQNEKKKMEEAMKDTLSPLADEYLHKELEKMNQFYQAILITEFNLLLDHIAINVEEQYELMFSALSNSDDLETWINIRNQLQIL